MKEGKTISVMGEASCRPPRRSGCQDCPDYLDKNSNRLFRRCVVDVIDGQVIIDYCRFRSAGALRQGARRVQAGATRPGEDQRASYPRHHCRRRGEEERLRATKRCRLPLVTGSQSRVAAEQ
ncbi:unnamed protein product [Linum trigynum]|uniref:Transposase n=1 Tax=Linum trigynum TaxID=586398 RepID=A0AAV2D1P6_9ROSI